MTNVLMKYNFEGTWKKLEKNKQREKWREFSAFQNMHKNKSRTNFIRQQRTLKTNNFQEFLLIESLFP